MQATLEDLQRKVASCSISGHDSELWYHDGSVVLEAEGTYFKVYSGILAKSSPVFQDMFAFPQRPDCEMYDGCPLVHMPDTAQDLRHFLKAMHDCRYVCRDHHSPNRLHTNTIPYFPAPSTPPN